MITLGMYNRRIESNIDNVGSAVRDILDYLLSVYGPLDDCTLFEIKVILNELILNAVRHGNREDEKKFVEISASIKEGNNLFIIIEDSGDGYDYSQVIKKTNPGGSLEDICNMKETGRGILIVRSLCDKIKFNKKGNKILVIKNIDSD